MLECVYLNALGVDFLHTATSVAQEMYHLCGVMRSAMQKITGRQCGMTSEPFYCRIPLLFKSSLDSNSR
ncbi:MAG: hypothetical protein RJB39_648 [Candidatus Parcubacteria bacterium]|jgi:hypothetical protein